MDETIHINVEVHKSNTHYVNIVKTRLWSAILSSINWLIKNPIPGSINVQSGLGLMIINNLAIAVEGFIADLIIEHLDDHELIKSKQVKNVARETWQPKKKKYNEIFEKNIESYPEYKSIEIFFLLRNNISHGKTHLEISKTDIVTREKTFIESTDKNYQIVRRYLIRKNIIKERDTSSNAEILWKLNIAIFFFHEVKRFLFTIIGNNESEKKQCILSELKSSFNVI